jgi:hypothetical protein
MYKIFFSFRKREIWQASEPFNVSSEQEPKKVIPYGLDQGQVGLSVDFFRDDVWTSVN